MGQCECGRAGQGGLRLGVVGWAGLGWGGVEAGWGGKRWGE